MFRTYNFGPSAPQRCDEGFPLLRREESPVRDDGIDLPLHSGCVNRSLQMNKQNFGLMKIMAFTSDAISFSDQETNVENV